MRGMTTRMTRDDFDRNDVADAFAGYLPPVRPDDAVDASDDDSVSTLLCTASNPPGTVSATALLSGRILDVEFSPEAARMTGRELAEEIRSVAALANQQARAAQHAVMATLMDRLRKDPAETRSFRTRAGAAFAGIGERGTRPIARGSLRG